MMILIFVLGVLNGVWWTAAECDQEGTYAHLNPWSAYWSLQRAASNPFIRLLAPDMSMQAGAAATSALGTMMMAAGYAWKSGKPGLPASWKEEVKDMAPRMGAATTGAGRRLVPSTPPPQERRPSVVEIEVTPEPRRKLDFEQRLAVGSPPVIRLVKKRDSPRRERKRALGDQYVMAPNWNQMLQGRPFGSVTGEASGGVLPALQVSPYGMTQPLSIYPRPC